MIYRFQPFSLTKEVGKEYNGHCEIVPNPDDWIMILDYDAMILTDETYKVINEAIKHHGDSTDVFGAMTNRVGLSYQRYHDEMDESDSIKKHYRDAVGAANKYPNGQCKDVKFIAGFFMLFKKSYWLRNKFQEKIVARDGTMFDYNFSIGAGKAGRCKVIMGAYLFHTYRMHFDTWKTKKHLL